ncbi:MAG: filamentous hemagglutinin N-terminal domain-containing protein [Elusimicrobia bacterium]|nr:filamentous hemagglutinin N-terminal domain-containing protein [Elusimicrobiota bacterium]
MKHALLKALRLLLALSVTVPSPLWANPSGGQVAAGIADILNQGGQTVTIQQASNLAVINWHDFSIQAGELTRFIQPSQLAAVLNRVTGGDPSAIYGALQANGRVFLVNPNGVLVGASGVVNAQSFTASTLDVRDGEFMAGGDLHFFGASLNSVRNAGTINALGGDVYLIAHQVENSGRISAPAGTVGLAAGSEVLLKAAGDEHVFVEAGGAAADEGVDQQGQIEAAAAELKAARGNVYGLAVNNGGSVHATGQIDRDGHVYLTAEDGTVSNSGELTAKRGDKGGTVKIVGGDIALKSGSKIDVSAPAGGGTALIGGDEHGANPDVPSAKTTTVEKGAVIDADATSSGGGGKIVLW